ncbi:MAG: hypothetical protein IKQ92_11455, partial [Clostridia bacterium]|nr:hypothetical protein [Clostridia bacterium]
AEVVRQPVLRQVGFLAQVFYPLSDVFHIVLLFCTDRKRARLPYGSIIPEPKAGRNGFILEFDSTAGCVRGRKEHH